MNAPSSSTVGRPPASRSAALTSGSASGGSGARRLAHAAALLAVLALGTYLRWTPRELVADLRPWPDAIEYEEAARSMAEGGGYLLWIGDRAYPPRYPPGLSLLIAATLPLIGTAPGGGIWVVLASALLTIAGTYVLARVAAGSTAGLVAALLVATSPLHVQWSRAVMSDVPGSAAVAWLSVWILATLRRRAGALEHVALGGACGLAVSLRQPLAIVGAAAFVVVGLLSCGTPRERARNALLLGIGVVLGVLPLLWLNAELFGSALRSGYAYWSPGTSFSLREVSREHQGRPSNVWLYAVQLGGGRLLYPWSAGLLLLGGILAAVRGDRATRALVVLASLLTVFFLTMHLAYALQASRLTLSLLPPLAAVMAIPCAASGPRLRRALAFALVAATLLIESRQEDAFGLPNDPVADYATLERIAAIAEPNAAIIARTNPFFFARVLRRDADRVWVPLRLDVHQTAIAVGRFAPVSSDASRGGWIEKPIMQPFGRKVAAAAVAEIAALCRAGRPIYLSEQMRDAVGFMRKLKRTLRRSFKVTRVAAAEPFVVRRIGCRLVDGAVQPRRHGPPASL